STVTFGGAAATVMNWESTEVLAIVPNAAVSGNVVVTVSNQPSNGLPFTVTVGGVGRMDMDIGAPSQSITPKCPILTRRISRCCFRAHTPIWPRPATGER